MAENDIPGEALGGSLVEESREEVLEGGAHALWVLDRVLQCTREEACLVSSSSRRHDASQDSCSSLQSSILASTDSIAHIKLVENRKCLANSKSHNVLWCYPQYDPSAHFDNVVYERVEGVGVEGGCPTYSSYRMTPRDHRSALWLYGCSCTNSGAM